MRNPLRLAVLALTLTALFLVSACTAQPQPTATPAATVAPASTPAAAKPAAEKPAPTKDKIRIGQAISLSGPLAIAASTTNLPVNEMWVKEVNANGGIMVKEYGKKLPIEFIKYDDKSDPATMTKLLEKLILEDKVDFVLSPTSTAFHFAAAPIANKYNYILIGSAGGAVKLKEMMPNLPYFFQVLNFADTQMPVLADVLKELGVKSAAIIFIGDLHGIEYSGVAVPEFAAKGIDVKMVKSYTPGIKDLSPMLKEAQALNVDAFVGFTYPDETFLVTQQAIELGMNFKAFHLNVGSSNTAYKQTFGDAIEGVMGPGVWYEKSKPGQEFISRFKQVLGREPDNYWGQLYFYASLQHFQQAIEEAGTLDQKKIRDLLETKTYDTILGPFKYEGRFFQGYQGRMGQWQKGVFEIIDPGPNRTAAPIPKPAWPKR